MKKLLFLLLLFSVAINAMEGNNPQFSQEVIERAKKTNLIEAIKNDDIEVVKYFIANGTNVNETGNYKPLFPFAHFTPPIRCYRL